VEVKVQFEFLNLLAALATLARVDLTPAVIALYDTALEPLGYENAIRVLQKLACKTSPRTGLPTIDEIRAELGARELTIDEKARQVAALIANKIASVGGYNTSRAERELGDVAWEVVGRYGGWQAVCSMADQDNLDTLMAQWRELAKGTLSCAHVPGGNEPPRLPPAPTRRGMLQIVKPSDFEP
jgi:hypothetical protein